MGDSNVTKEFLEEALGKEIESFEVNSGSNVGDGYTSDLFTIDVTLKNSKSTPTATGSDKNSEKDNQSESELKSEPSANASPSKLHLLLKCYPMNPARQGFLTEANVFQKELHVYNTIIPELVRFQVENELDTTGTGNNNEGTVVKKPSQFYAPPFPKFYYGLAIDYKNLAEGESKVCTNILDNCILMADLRKVGGFKLANRLTGFDYDHAKLVTENQAKLHALSWAYKIKTDTPSLERKFPFLQGGIFDFLDENTLGQMTVNNFAMFEGVIKNADSLSDAKKKTFLESLERFKGISVDVTKIYFAGKPPTNAKLNKDNILRVPQLEIENEEPWLVLTHGDAWLNNMMFRYDEATGKPVEVLFVDLQVTREDDPFNDVAYNFFTSTGAELRREHLDEILKLYHETFIQVCQNFGVPPLPGFDLNEVRRRFHRAKAFGLSMAATCLPIFLNEQKNIVDIDTIKGDGAGADAVMEQFLAMGKGFKGNAAYSKRVLGLVTEFHEQGVI